MGNIATVELRYLFLILQTDFFSLKMPNLFSHKHDMKEWIWKLMFIVYFSVFQSRQSAATAVSLSRKNLQNSQMLMETDMSSASWGGQRKDWTYILGIFNPSSILTLFEFIQKKAAFFNC